MKFRRSWRIPLLAFGILAWSAPGFSADAPPMFESPHAGPIALSTDQSRVYVVNTPAATVDVIGASSGDVIARIAVGVDPVGLAVRPDGKELWVANHISDSVTVIDTDPTSPSYHHVTATVQDFDDETGITIFDEPTGVAFASNEKAYVSLSSVNRVAIVDVSSKEVTGHLEITAQEPRSISVVGERLYVVPFESGNQTELAGCLSATLIDGDQCTFDLIQHVVLTNNVLSLFYDADIVRDPNVPDRDLFVYDTTTDELVTAVSSVGTLLYGVTADSTGRVFVAQTEARNDANGRAGTLKQELVDLDNRMFLNQIGVVDCSASGCGMPMAIELEVLPPDNPEPGQALATPYAIAVSADDATLVVTAAGSNQLFTMDAESGEVLGRVEVDWVPRGIALRSNGQGSAERAWVYNAVGNSVSVVAISSSGKPSVVDLVYLEDPTDPQVKLGRYAFNNANASSTQTFSCESCHPNGHTDQLIWVLGGPACNIDGCTQIPPRTTMPVRGLRDTQPYHWDGVPGDPYGGINGEFPDRAVEPNCTDGVSCIRNLLDGALASTMCDQNACVTNGSGQLGLLEEDERVAMGAYLLGIPYPPPRERAMDDVLSPLAQQGFYEFFHNDNRNTCGVGSCHVMPFWNGTNIGGSGMDAPTFRGLPDRWLLLPQGRANIVELLNVTNATNNYVPWDPAKGFDELSMWALTFGTEEAPATNFLLGGFGPMGPWQMFLEGSMGFSGAYGRQITLNFETAGPAGRESTEEFLVIVERGDAEGAVVLKGEGVLFSQGNSQAEFEFAEGAYVTGSGSSSYTRDELLDAAAAGELVVTLTARSGPNVDPTHAQPGLWRWLDAEMRNGAQDYPRLPAENPIVLHGIHVEEGASVLIDGRRVEASVGCAGSGGAQLPDCADALIEIELEASPKGVGLHFLQVQNPGGLQSNEMLIFLDAVAEPTGLQVSPDGMRVLISKDVGGERWAIVANADDGTVTGNVFSADTSEPSFVWCDDLPQAGDGMLGFSCYGAGPCEGGTCRDEDWLFIADVELPASFFEPQADPTPSAGAEPGAAVPDGASGLRISRDGRRTMLSKDAGGLRWAITRNDDGTVTGNVYDPAGGAPQFVWCSALDQGVPQDGILRFTCSGAAACQGGVCLAEDWSEIGEVELPESFFLP